MDTSDHEVNIKILLDQVVADGDLTEKQRNDLLASMTDEVGTLVLRDNYEQNHALANAAIQAPQLLHVHEDWIRRLERQGLLDRALESLPSRKTVAGAARAQAGADRAGAVGAAGLHQDRAGRRADRHRPRRRPVPAQRPVQLLPDARCGRPTASGWRRHPLRREIIVTQVVNDLVNGAGITFFHRLSEETAATADELVRANFVAREIFGSRALIDEIDSYDNKIDAARADPDAAGDAHAGRAGVALADQQPAARRWTARRTVDFFGVVAQQVVTALPELLGGREADAFDARRDALRRAGACPRTSPSGWRCCRRRTRRSNIVETAKPRRRRPARGRPGALRARRAARPVRAGRPDPRAAARRPLADDGAGRAARRPARRARAADRPGAGRRPSSDQPVPVRVADWEEDDAVVVSPRGGHARRDLLRRPRRPGPAVGRAAGGPDAAVDAREPRPRGTAAIEVDRAPQERTATWRPSTTCSFTVAARGVLRDPRARTAPARPRRWR